MACDRPREELKLALFIRLFFIFMLQVPSAISMEDAILDLDKFGRSLEEPGTLDEDNTGRPLEDGLETLDVDKTGRSLEKPGTLDVDKTGRSLEDGLETLDEDKTGRPLEERETLDKDKTVRSLEELETLDEVKSGKSLEEPETLDEDKTGRPLEEHETLDKDKTGRSLEELKTLDEDKTGKSLEGLRILEQDKSGMSSETAVKDELGTQKMPGSSSGEVNKEQELGTWYENGSGSSLEAEKIEQQLGTLHRSSSKEVDEKLELGTLEIPGSSSEVNEEQLGTLETPGSSLNEEKKEQQHRNLRDGISKNSSRVNGDQELGTWYEDGSGRWIVGLEINVADPDRLDTVEGHFNLPRNLSAITVCFWIKPLRWTEYSDFFGQHKFDFYSHQGRLTMHKLNVYIIIFDIFLELHTWTHLCAIMHQKGFDAFANGRQLSIFEPSISQDDSSISFVPSGLIFITLSKESPVYRFLGYLADVVMFPRSLHVDDVRKVMRGDPETDALPFIIDRNTATSVTLSYQEILSPPDDDISVILADSMITYKESVRICQSYGGKLPDKRYEDKNTIVDKCIAPGYLEMGDLWLYTPDYKPNGNMTNCELLTFRIANNLSKYMKWPCEKHSPLICCYVPRNKFTYLKGNHGLSEARFLLVRDKNKNLTLEGVDLLRITWNKTEVQVQNLGGEKLFFTNPPTSNFMGRRVWWTADGQQSLNLSLSTCGPREFTCNNGECVPIECRCDGVPGQCRDNSDDDDTCNLFHGPPSYYFKFSPPPKTSVNLSVTLINLRDVNANTNKLQMVLEVKLYWRDPQLTFYDLRPPSNHKTQNHMDTNHINSLWHPTFIFPMANFEDNLNIIMGEKMKRLVSLIREGNGTPTLIDSRESLEYQGGEVTIELGELMAISTHCPFDLRAFPFDYQRCVVPVDLEYGEEDVATESIITTSTQLSLPVYRMMPVRCWYNATKDKVIKQVQIAILLQRRSEAFFLSALGPCIVLCLLGHLSFVAYSIHHFHERASTSLSLLIVVAALFSQSVTNLPSSAAPKAIDVWFFYFILRFFIFFVSHCCVEAQLRRVAAQKATADTVDEEIETGTVLIDRKPEKQTDKSYGTETGIILTDRNPEKQTDTFGLGDRQFETETGAILTGDRPSAKQTDTFGLGDRKFETETGAILTGDRNSAKQTDRETTENPALWTGDRKPEKTDRTIDRTFDTAEVWTEDRKTAKLGSWFDLSKKQKYHTDQNETEKNMGSNFWSDQKYQSDQIASPKNKKSNFWSWKLKYPMGQIGTVSGVRNGETCFGRDLVRPETVNKVSVVFGLVLDGVFLILFYCYLTAKNSKVVQSFYEFDDCFR